MQTTVEIERKVKLETFDIFTTTAHRNPADEQSGTGDVDYTSMLAEHLKEKGSKAIYIRGCFSEQAVFSYVARHQASSNPILHIMINAPRTGFAFTQGGLRDFKDKGGRVVITAVEFFKHANDHHKIDTLDYLREAEAVVFLDEIDKNAALLSAQQLFPQDKALHTLLSKAKVIAVPNTIEVTTCPYSERGKDILSFGMIRVGKGFAHIIQLAELIAKSANPKIKDKKIWVVGTVQKHDPGALRELHRLMLAIYPNLKSDIDKAKDEGVETLKALLLRYQSEGVKRTLPLELRIDVDQKELGEIFNRCRYSFLPGYRGATLRNSSMTNSIAQGFITYSHIEFGMNFTPASLKPKGKYHKAFLLVNESESTRDANEYHKYAETVLSDIIAREEDEKLNNETLVVMKKLSEEELSREVVIARHQEVYAQVKGPRPLVERKDDAEKITPLRTLTTVEIKTRREVFLQWRNQHRRVPPKVRREWIQEYQTNRYMVMANGAEFDIKKRHQRNSSALLNRLSNVEGPMTKEMKKHILSIRTTGEILTPEEWHIFDLLLKNEWTSTHTTNAIEPIMNSGGLLLSPQVRSERDAKFNMEELHTNPGEGHRNDIFFTYASGKAGTVRFLGQAPTVIHVDHNILKQTAPTTLMGMYLSDHFHAYAVEQDAEPMLLYGTRFEMSYRRIEETKETKDAKEVKEKKETQDRWVKHYRFEHPDGQVFTQTIEKGDEIFAHPLMSAALTLLTIEKVRFLGLKAWADITKITDVKRLQHLVQTIYHPGVLEIHKSGEFLLRQPGVRIENRKPKSTRSITDSSVAAKDLIKASLMGKTDLVINALDRGELNIRTKVSLQKITLTLLDAGILSGNKDHVHALLSRSVDLDKNLSCVFLRSSSASNSFDSIELSPILIAVLLSIPEISSELLSDVISVQEMDAKQNSGKALSILKLLCEVGTPTENPDIRHLAIPNERDLEIAIRLFQPEPSVFLQLLRYSKHITGDNLPLIWAVCLNSKESEKIVAEMIAMGANVNKRITFVNLPSTKEILQLPKGTTPLIAAVFSGNMAIARLLIQKGALIKKPLISAESATEVSRYEGFTPLMIAKELKNPEMIQLLTSAEATTAAKATHLQAGRNAIKNQTRENYPIRANTIALILTGLPSEDSKESSERLFYVGNFAHRKNFFPDNILPFLPVNEPDFSKKALQTWFNKWLSLNLKEAQFTWLEAGQIQVEVASKGVLYSIKFIVVDLGRISDRMSVQLRSMGTHSLITSNRIETLPVLKSIKHLIHSIEKHNAQKHFDAKELKECEEEISAFLANQYQLITAASIGDGKGISACCLKGGDIDLNLPVSREISNSSINILVLTAFEVACIHLKFNCALELIRGSKKVEFSSQFSFELELIETLIQYGQLEIIQELYKKIKNKLNTDHYINKAAQYNQLDIYRFFLEVKGCKNDSLKTRKESELQDAVTHLAPSILSASLTPECPKTNFEGLLQSVYDNCRYKSYNFTYLSQAQVNERALDCFRLIAPMVKQDSPLFSWFLEYTLTKGEIRWVEKVLKFISKDAISNWKDSYFNHVLHSMKPYLERKTYGFVCKVAKAFSDKSPEILEHLLEYLRNNLSQEENKTLQEYFRNLGIVTPSEKVTLKPF